MKWKRSRVLTKEKVCLVGGNRFLESISAIENYSFIFCVIGWDIKNISDNIIK